MLTNVVAHHRASQMENHKLAAYDHEPSHKRDCALTNYGYEPFQGKDYMLAAYGHDPSHPQSTLRSQKGDCSVYTDKPVVEAYECCSPPPCLAPVAA